MNTKSIIISALSLFAGASSGFSAITKFESKTAYDAVVSSPAFVENFEFANNNQSFASSDPALQAGLSYSSSSGSLMYFNTQFGSPQITSSQLWNPSSNVITIDISVPTQTIAFDMATWNTSAGVNGNTIKVTIDGSSFETFTVSTLNNNPGFFGFVTDSGLITQIQLTSANITVGVDNISVGSVAIPEPSAAAMLAGFAVLGGAVLRRRRSA